MMSVHLFPLRFDAGTAAVRRDHAWGVAPREIKLEGQEWR